MISGLGNCGLKIWAGRLVVALCIIVTKLPHPTFWLQILSLFNKNQYKTIVRARLTGRPGSAKMNVIVYGKKARETTAKTRLPSNLKPTTRECVHLVSRRLATRLATTSKFCYLRYEFTIKQYLYCIKCIVPILIHCLQFTDVNLCYECYNRIRYNTYRPTGSSEK